ncbi:SdrD B-like domain-containing protein [Microbacterium sp. 179-I 3D3 NHS]|uniref:DUF11 domain-containing protein n=1 Tax=Microbacterium sp. 179-I 3D3 NHS TaxID=3142382 RepID=UPI0039A22FD6
MAAPSRSPRRGSRAALGVALIAAIASTMFAAAPASAADGSIAGVVYQDFDDDGARDAASGDVIGDTGLGGVGVTATDATGVVRATATTAADGSYTLAVSGAATTQVRVDFALPDGYRPARIGADNGSTVQFVDLGATGVDLGATQEGMVWTGAGTPQIVVPSQRSVFSANAFQSGSAGVTPNLAGQPALFGFPYTTSGSPASGRTVLATQGQMGTVWGTAHHGERFVFSAASFRRGTMLGPAGLGAIYLTDALSGAPNARPFVTIPNAGADPRPADLTGYDWFHDSVAFPAVGKIGLGDIEISADQRTLYAVNLNDRRLYAVPLTPGATPSDAPTPATPQAIDIPLSAAQGCDPAQVRPYGLGSYRGSVYVTLTCTGPTVGELRAWVVPMDEETRVFGPAVLSAPLTFSRALRYSSAVPSPTQTNNHAPWNDTWNTQMTPTPVASSVVFDSAGNLVLSVKDRTAGQFGVMLGSAVTNDARAYGYIGAGDLLKACPDGAGAYVLENDGTCGSTTSTQPTNDWGPGGGKFYETTYWWRRTAGGPPVDYHGNTALGSALQIPGRSTLIATTIDSTTDGNALNRDGVRVFGNSDGRAVRGGTLTQLSATPDGSFAKAGGLGDLTSLVAAAPVEIGNRVWLDADGDGVQGAAEAPIAGVTVRLFAADGTLVATAVTGPQGEYLFSSSPGTSTGSAAYGLPLTPESDYEIRLDEPGDYGSGGPLHDLGPTVSAAGGDVAVDSNGIPQSPVLVTAAVRTPSAGSADHTVDFGFVPLLSLGNRLWSDTGPGQTNNGVLDAGESPIEGATVELLDGAGAPVLGADGAPITTTTDAQGNYRFDRLPAGDYRVRVAAANFAAGAVLEGWTSATGAATTFDAVSDDRDKGEDAADPAATGITSATIALVPGVVGEAVSGAGAGAHGPHGDAYDTLTVDFGFVPLIDLTLEKRLTSGPGPYRLGDEVTFDLIPSNLGPGTALPGLTVSDRLPAGLDLVSADGENWSAAVVTGQEVVAAWEGDPLDAGEQASPLTVTARVTSVDAASLRNVAVVQPSPNQPTAESIPVGSAPDAYENGDPAPDAANPSNNDDAVELPVLPPTLSLGNRLWFDTGDGAALDNGRFDLGEEPVARAVVELLAADGTPVRDAAGEPRTTTTDVDGYYRFDGLAPGQYRVRVAAANFDDAGVLAGYLSSTGASTSFGAGDDSRDSGDDARHPGTTGITSATVDLQPGVTGETDRGATDAGANGPFGDPFDNLTVDFGFVPGLSLGNRLWFDSGAEEGHANNGVVDDDEQPVAEAVVELLDAAGAPVLDADGAPVTTTTDASGHYRFDGLPAGDYRVRVAAANFAEGAPLEGWLSSSPTTDAASRNNADKGIDAPDPAVTGISSGVVALGRDNPTGDADAGAAGARAHGPNGDAADLLTVDFGFTQAYAIGDRVWLDDDGDGRQGPREQPVAGVLVALTDADGAPVTDLDGDPVAPVRTGDDGRYLFDGLRPGTYRVVFADTPPTLRFTRPGSGAPEGDSNPDASGVTSPFLLGPGGPDTTEVTPDDRVTVAERIDRTIDAGLTPLLAVGDHVWVDRNRDGRQDAGEPPVAGVTVTLLRADGQPAFDADGAPVAPVQTDANGHYVFDGLAPGDYRVRFSGWPVGYHPTGARVAEASAGDDSNADASGLTPVFTLSGASADVRPVAATDGVARAVRIDPTIDLGIVADLYAVGDVVWFDANANGRQDAGETPVSGVTVTLRNADGTPARDWRGAVVPPQSTEDDGRYLFDGLLPGQYFIQFTDLPDGYRFTTNGSGGDADSNPRGDGRTPVFTLGAGSADIRTVVGSDGTLMASFIDVTIDAGLVTVLPPTGLALPLPVIVIGALLLVAGAILVAVRRRKGS